MLNLHTMKRLLFLSLALLLAGALGAQTREVRLKIVQTSDLHGNYYPHDFIRGCDSEGSLARVCAYVEEQRRTYGDRLILLDNGDILQGQPTAYYYNYVDTVAPHLTAQMLNYMRYDAGNMGNHDIEAGRRVFDRWAAQCSFPVLGANIVDTLTGRPHFRPYTVIEREGVRIAVLGLITPAIPMWLPQSLWPGLRFDDMEQTARQWMDTIRRKEQPDLVIGLFHTGKQAYTMGGRYRENAALEVAGRVPGFDMVLIGHDHARACLQVAGPQEGDSVWVLNPANNGRLVADVDVCLTLDPQGNVTGKRIDGRLADMAAYTPSEAFLSHFAAQRDSVQAFVSKKIGTMARPISTRPAYFGPSAFVDLIHTLQLAISGAQVSLAAPLSFDAQIPQGDIRVSDMFNLYKYENMLYTMRLTGREIKDALELSYDQWINRMQSPDDHLLLLRGEGNGEAGERTSFRHPSYNFDSAAGIVYTVQVDAPRGERVRIERMADGTPFDLNKTYEVAVNSYRGNGGGELLTQGAGIPQEELKTRIVRSTDKDLRYYLMQYIERVGTVDPKPLDQWRLLPEAWTAPAARRDYKLLFGDEPAW